MCVDKVWITTSLLCTSCSHWIHKSCSGIKGRFKADPPFQCMRCRGLARPIDGRPLRHVTVNGHDLEAVDSFCYLGDTVSASGGTSTSINIRCRAAWENFVSYFSSSPIVPFPCRPCCRIYTACVRSVMLYASECWALRNDEHNRLICNDRAMVRWICGIKPEEKVNTPSLYQHLNIPHLDNTLRCNRLRWAGHVHRSQTWTGGCLSLVVEDRRGKGRPRKTWRDVINEDLRFLNLSLDMAEDRDKWRKILHDANRLTSPTPQREKVTKCMMMMILKSHQKRYRSACQKMEDSHAFIYCTKASADLHKYEAASMVQLSKIQVTRCHHVGLGFNTRLGHSTWSIM